MIQMHCNMSLVITTTDNLSEVDVLVQVATWAVLPPQLGSGCKSLCDYACHAWDGLMQNATWTVLALQLGTCCKPMCLSCVRRVDKGCDVSHVATANWGRVASPCVYRPCVGPCRSTNYQMIVLKCFYGDFARVALKLVSTCEKTQGLITFDVRARPPQF